MIHTHTPPHQPLYSRGKEFISHLSPFHCFTSSDRFGHSPSSLYSETSTVITPEHCFSQERHNRQTGLLKNRFLKEIKKQNHTNKKKNQIIRSQTPFNQALQHLSISSALLAPRKAQPLTALPTLSPFTSNSHKKTRKQQNTKITTYLAGQKAHFHYSGSPLTQFSSSQGSEDWGHNPLPLLPSCWLPEGLPHSSLPPQTQGKQLLSTTGEEGT